MNICFEYLADRPEAAPQVARWWFDEWGYLRPGASVGGFTAKLGWAKIEQVHYNGYEALVMVKPLSCS